MAIIAFAQIESLMLHPKRYGATVGGSPQEKRV
jgi:hypothetical protein